MFCLENWWGGLDPWAQLGYATAYSSNMGFSWLGYTMLPIELLTSAPRFLISSSKTANINVKNLPV